MKNNPAQTIHPAISFLGIVALFQAMGGLMGWITANGIDGWYQALVKSPLNPPDYVFGIVWTVLYFLLALAFWRLWKKPHSKERTYILSLFLIQMILNWFWSPLFFTAHALSPSFFLIVSLIALTGLLCWKSWPMDKIAAGIFMPYMAWLTFAGHLSFYTWQNNPN